MSRESLKDFLVYEAEYPQERVDRMSDFELFDRWLKWHGIIGFTYEIIDMVNDLKLK